MPTRRPSHAPPPPKPHGTSIPVPQSHQMCLLSASVGTTDGGQRCYRQRASLLPRQQWNRTYHAAMPLRRREPPPPRRPPPHSTSVQSRLFHTAVPAATTLKQQREEDPAATSRSYAALLQRSAAASDPRLASSLHEALLRPGLLASDQFLTNHLLVAYFKALPRLRRHGLRLLDEMPRRNAVSWAASIAGIAQGAGPARRSRCSGGCGAPGARPASSRS